MENAPINAVDRLAIWAVVSDGMTVVLNAEILSVVSAFSPVVPRAWTWPEVSEDTSSFVNWPI